MDTSMEELRLLPPNIEPPGSVTELADKILIYGRFMDGLEYISTHLSTKTIASKTLVIRGNPGSGKKSLINKVQELCLKDAITVHINPYHHTEDYSALKYLANEVGIKSNLPNDEIVDAIVGFKKRIVVVLYEFEIFCRKKQSLLYLLTDMTQSNENISLVGLTVSLDCTENIEKRVRSRLNPVFYELRTPYGSKDEYIEFASLLLGGYIFKSTTKERLIFNYMINRSIRFLKRFLATLCSWEGKKLTIEEAIPIGESDTNKFLSLQSDVRLLTHRISGLTNTQLELLKVAVSYCNQDESGVTFSLTNLDSFIRNRGIKNFDSTSDTLYKDIMILCSVSLLKPLKPDLMINQFSKFTICIAPAQFKHFLEMHPIYQNTRTDGLWRKLH